jgi:hypothetical protein
VLSVPLGESLTEEQRKEHTMYQLQRLFGHLELSERRHYDPTPWCYAYKDFDGKPTNTLIQQDAQVINVCCSLFSFLYNSIFDLCAYLKEYITTLLDRVEFGLKGTPRAKLVDQVRALGHGGFVLMLFPARFAFHSPTGARYQDEGGALLHWRLQHGAHVD